MKSRDLVGLVRAHHQYPASLSSFLLDATRSDTSMRNLYFFLGALLLVDGVFGDDVKVSLSVMEGDSVTLKHHTAIPEDASADWCFGDEIIAIKETGGSFSTSKGDKVGFKDRLNVDKQNGSLTITNITTKDTRDYKLKISGKAVPTTEIFSVTVTDAMKSLSVTVGDTVTLHTGVTDIQKDDLIQWKFGDQVLKGPGDTRWRNENGDLTIRNIQSQQYGDYELEINTNSMILHRKLHINISGNMTKVSVKAGEYITLNTGLSNTQGYDQIILKFEDSFAEINKWNIGFVTHDTSADGRFKDRLWMPSNTASLTIHDSRITDSGVYHLNMISSSHTIQRNISVTVSGSDRSGAVSGISGASVVLMLWAVTVSLLHEV
ncbi:hypothetical protein R3I94_017904 [Phoxinus phoxinus]